MSEFTHLEAELAFITFEDLMEHIETMVSMQTVSIHIFYQNPDPTTLPTPARIRQICDTLSKLLTSPQSASLIQTLNPSFKPPTRPFARLSYAEAIAWLRARSIKKHDLVDDQGHIVVDPATGRAAQVDHAFGDDIGDKAERAIVEEYGAPVWICAFPKELKAFYMKRMSMPVKQLGEDEDEESLDPGKVLTESCDLLLPGVGEVVGTSARILFSRVVWPGCVLTS